MTLGFRREDQLPTVAYDDPAATKDRPADVLEARVLAGVTAVDSALTRLASDSRARDALLDIRLALTGARA